MASLRLDCACGFFCLLSHGSELRAIVAVVHDIMRHNQMVLRIERHLHVVTDDAGTASTGCHRARVRRQSDG